MSKTTFKVDPYLVNGSHRITVNVIGAGGTGSLVVTKLARLHKAMNHLDHPGFYVKLIDPDVIEDFNVGRQLFTSNDVGCYKAENVITKINHAFGLDWDSYIKPYDAKNHSNVNIVICAVDNVKARRKIIKGFYEGSGQYHLSRKFFLIDCGNTRDYGQVILSDNANKLKNIYDISPDWDKQDTEEQQGEGCSYAEKLKEQDLFVNDWVSLFAVNFIKELLFNKQISYQAVFFDSNELVTSKLKVDVQEDKEEVRGTA